MSFCFSWNYILQHATRSAVLRNLIHDEYFKGKKLYRVRADLMRKRQKAHSHKKETSRKMKNNFKKMIKNCLMQFSSETSRMRNKNSTNFSLQ